MARPKIACVVGTRPDAIKTAPVVLELRRYPELCECLLVSTGQHQEMLAQALGSFDLMPDIDLALMRHGQSLAQLSARCLEGLDKVFEEIQPQMVMAQGDTTTTFIAGLASFYKQIPFGHIEAGLRTPTVWNPFPEEFNRRAVGLFAAQHYAPTQLAARNLMSEGKHFGSIYITGNSGIDAVLQVAEKRPQTWFPDFSGRILLLTTHRRENWGEPQREIAQSCLEILNTFEDTLLVVPMHKNPEVRKTLTSLLGTHSRVLLIEPPEYADFVKLMQRSYLILSDSGGVQEEAPAFGIPVLVLRDTTERPEGVEAGTAKLVGTQKASILKESTVLLTDSESYKRMAQAVSPYGDGRAAQRIRYIALNHFELHSPKEPMWS